MRKYKILIIADAFSSLSREELEAKLVASLFDIETGEKISDGDDEQCQIEDYELTEAIPI